VYEKYLRFLNSSILDFFEDSFSLEKEGWYDLNSLGGVQTHLNNEYRSFFYSVNILTDCLAAVSKTANTKG